MGTGRAQIELTRFSPLLLSRKSRRSPSPDSAMRVSEISGISDFWRESLGDPSVCVAFLDGPADTTHESLRRAQLKHLYVPPFSRSRVGGWSLRHGTHVVSIVLGQHDSTGAWSRAAMSGTGGSDIPRCGRPAGVGVTVGPCTGHFVCAGAGS